MKIGISLIITLMLSSCGTMSIEHNSNSNSISNSPLSTPLGRTPLNPLGNDPYTNIISDALWEGTGDYDSFY